MQLSTLSLAILCGAASSALGAFEGFAPRVDLPLTPGYSPTASALADFDNDGDLDIAVTCFTSLTFDRVAVILNNGNGTFAHPVYVGVGSSPTAIVATDVNLDGKADFVTANRDSDDFSLRLGNGDGTFQSEYFQPVGDNPQDLAVADLNADSLPDIAVVNEFDDSVSVYFNDGDGTFTLDATYSTNNPDGFWGNGPRGITAVDLNFDTLPDIVTANTGDDRATIMYNIPGAAGSFFNGEFALFLDTDAQPIKVDAHDHDRDGDIDLIFACASSSRIHRRFNEFNQTPGAVYAYFPTSNSFFIGGARPVGLCTADFDDLESDADLDIVVADELGDDIDILLNNGAGGILFGGRFEAASSPQEPSAGDLDGDGDDDVVSPHFGGASVGVFFNTSTIIGGPTPIVRIDEPGDYGGFGGCVCGPSMTITGVATIPEGGVFDHYTLDYRRSNVGTWTTIYTSEDPVPEPGDDLAPWNLSGQPEGFYILRLTATSSSGLTASDEAVVWVSQNYNTVNFHFAAGYDGDATAIAGRNICVYGFVNDDACGSNNYTVDYRPTSGGAWLPVDPSIPVYIGDRLNTEIARWNTIDLGIPDGEYAVRVTAENGCRQTNALTRTVTVDNTPPLAEISGPSNCFWISPEGSILVKGTAFDDNLASWTLEFTGGPYNYWVPIVSGSTANVIENVLGEWDIDGLPPCAYTLRLRVYDQSRLGCGTSTWRTDSLVTVNVGCRADLAAPFEVLDLADINAFVSSFTAGCP
jgi:hypothetical protein